MARTKLDLEGDPSIESSQKNPVQERIESVKGWFERTCVDDRDKILAVCAVTGRMLADQFNMRTRENLDEVWALVFYECWLQILEFLSRKTSQYTEFEVQVEKCVRIGYTNYLNDDDEKVGNFMPFMEWVGKDTSIVYNPHETADDNFIRWKEQNSIKNVDMQKEIQDKTALLINRKYGMNIGSPDAVIPIFCIFLDNVVNILKQDYKDAGEDVSKVKMNVLSQFTVTYSFDTDDNREIVDFSPSVAIKMEIKNDTKAENKA